MNAARWSTSVPSVGSIGRTIRTRIAPWTSRRRRLSSKWSARRAGWWTRWTRLHSFQRLLGPGLGRLASRSNLSRWPKSGRHDSWPWMHGCAFATLSRFWTRAWTATSMSEKVVDVTIDSERVAEGEESVGKLMPSKKQGKFVAANLSSIDVHWEKTIEFQINGGKRCAINYLLTE